MENMGQLIREYRKRKSMTLKQLADKANISVSFLSELERGISNFSIATLKKIAQALEISTLGFKDTEENIEVLDFKTPTDSNYKDYSNDVKVVKSNHRIKIEFPGFSTVSELLTPDFNRRMEALYMKMKPDFYSGPEPIIDPKGEKFLYILEGTANITIYNETYSLSKGDSIYYPADAPFHFRSTSESAVEVIIVITPPGL